MRFLERFSGRRLVVASAVLAGLLVLPALNMGYVLDDYMHLAALEGLPSLASRFDLFTFANGDPEITTPFIERGPFPWWTYPRVRLSFFRPLSSALHWGEHALFGRAPVLAHVHSLLWYAAVAAIVAGLYRRTLPAGAAVLAALLYVIDETHLMPAAWLANRNALVAAAPGLLGLWAHLRAREDGWKPGRFWSVIGLGLGLAGGEAALGAFAYVLAYELTAAPGTLKARLVALWPAVALGVVYVGFYKALGYGARDSAIYIDPASTPLRFLAVAPARALALLGALVLAAPVDLWMFKESAKPGLVAAGGVAAIVTWLLLRRVSPRLDPEPRRWLRFWGVGCLLSLLPVLATFPNNRLLLFSTVGSFAVMSLAIGALPGALGGLGRVAVGVLVLLHLVVPWPGWLMGPRFFANLGQRSAASAAEMEVDDATLSQKRALVLAAPDASVGIYAPLIHWAVKGVVGKAWWVLAMTPHTCRVTRTDERTLELEVIGGKLLTELWEQLFRAEERHFAVGDTVRLDGAQVTVLATDGPNPTRVAFRSDQLLDREDLLLLRWDGKTLRRVAPLKVGEMIELPWLRGPMAFPE